MGGIPEHKVYGGHLEFFLLHVTYSTIVPVAGNNKGLFLTDEQDHRALALICNALTLENSLMADGAAAASCCSAVGMRMV